MMKIHSEGKHQVESLAWMTIRFNFLLGRVQKSHLVFAGKTVVMETQTVFSSWTTTHDRLATGRPQTGLHLWARHCRRQESPDRAALWRPRRWCRAFLWGVWCSAPSRCRRSPSLVPDACPTGQNPGPASGSGPDHLDRESRECKQW